MDTKNLLDVCDSIRIRFPQASTEPTEFLPSQLDKSIDKDETQQIYSNQSMGNEQNLKIVEENADDSPKNII